MKKIDVKAVTLSIGVTWAIGALLLGWIAAFGWGTCLVQGLSSLYIGFRPGFFGGIIGAIWAFVDGAITGFLIGSFYNFFTDSSKRAAPAKKSTRKK